MAKIKECRKAAGQAQREFADEGAVEMPPLLFSPFYIAI